MSGHDAGRFPQRKVVVVDFSNELVFPKVL